MTTKFISLATGIVLLDVYLQSQLYSSDPLFLFASSNLLVNAGLLIIVSLMVAVSFKERFKRWWSFAGCAAMAIIFGSVGLLGTFFSNVFYAFPQVLMPLDYMFLLEAGIVFGICSLSYKHQKVPYSVNLPRPAFLSHKLAFPVPKILQSPTSLGRG